MDYRDFKADRLVALPMTPDNTGDTLEAWIAFARRDDCLDLMVPSDLRIILGEVSHLARKRSE